MVGSIWPAVFPAEEPFVFALSVLSLRRERKRCETNLSQSLLFIQNIALWAWPLSLLATSHKSLIFAFHLHVGSLSTSVSYTMLMSSLTRPKQLSMNANTRAYYFVLVDLGLFHYRRGHTVP